MASQDLQLVIPTHARAARQITLMQLPPAIRKRTLVVTSTQQDADEIVERYGHTNITVAASTTSIANKRHWIMQNVKARYIFMMDDDMTFFARCHAKQRTWAKDGWQPVAGAQFLYAASPAEFAKAFQQVADYFKRGVAAVGISSRMGNNRQREAWQHDTRMMHAFGVDAKVYKKLRLNFGEVQCREDFNITLRLLRAGYGNSVLFDFCCSPGSYGAAGGASSERTMEQSNAEAVHLATLHPGLVKVVDKAYTSSIPRKEVIIQWKRAAQEGRGDL